ncbi:unnamed protein product [Heligmosomoides polygyrus]|uniref:DOCKER domain-containing protein n=1 Tax=Heligmosomoides polygyrus TaxID=6339 RepID=A0A183GSP1_HELPZ|nr:unnamed protein product [Heligmosomoides polygyrus]
MSKVSTYCSRSAVIIFKSIHSRLPAVKTDVSLLGQPLTFRNCREAQNRFFKAALTEMLASWHATDLSKRGIPTQSLVNLYDKWGHGKFGMVLTGNIMVDPMGKETAENDAGLVDEVKAEVKERVTKIQKHFIVIGSIMQRLRIMA